MGDTADGKPTTCPKEDEGKATRYPAPRFKGTLVHRAPRRMPSRFMLLIKGFGPTSLDSSRLAHRLVVFCHDAITPGSRDMRHVKKALRPPVLPKELEPCALANIGGAEIERGFLDACNLANQTGEHVRFDGIKVIGGTMSATKLADLMWLDVIVERCDLSMIEWAGPKLTRVEMRGCRVTGAKLHRGELDDVRFVECLLDYVSFAGARFRQVSFEACRLQEANFNGADVPGTSFVNCDLRGADFTGAKVQGADVSSSSLGEIHIGAGDVRGLVVNREQAAVLSQLMGLVLRDE